MSISWDFIQGLALGCEYVEAAPELGHPSTVIVDVLIIRLLIQW